MFVRLLTPQSVLDLYQLGETPMAVSILDAQSKEVLAEAVLSTAEDVVAFDILRDGWYILAKNAVEGEAGTAILAVTGIHPIVKRTLSATESRFVRLTDHELVITESRPESDGKGVPFVVLIDNQFRGLRDLQTYLVHFIPPFFEQVELLLLPCFITVAWGFILGRALSHLFGEDSIFNSRDNRLMVLAWSMTPLLILLAYFALLNGEGAITGPLAIILKIAAAFGVVMLVRRIEDWLNGANQGEAAEASLNRLLIYGWGVFPIAMYVMASGVGGLSGAALGSLMGGLVWLLLMYFVGLNFRGTLGYALLIGGFFLQIVQAPVINLVWDGWNSDPFGAHLIWLVVAIIGMYAGVRGAALKGSIDAGIKRYGYLISCLAFLFIFVNTNMQSEAADASATLLAGLAVIAWLGWMFFSGTTRWSSNRIIIGLLLLTFVWMQTWTMVDRWSIVYFVVWLVAGAMAFRRGEKAQGDQRKTKETASGPLFYRFPIRGMVAAAAVWLAALLILPSLVVGLEAQGVLQTSPDELMPLSDKRLWGGLMLTMQLTILGIVASFPIGLALAIGRRSNLPVVKYACILYIEVLRGVPLITVLFMATLLVPLVDPTLATIENAVRAWVGITLFSAAYLAENVRGGLQSIGRGQTEAAQAVGLSTWQTTLHILLPQALRAVIPALVGQFISLFKDTSLVFIVGLAEILGIASRVVAQPEFLQRRQETFLYVAIIFFVFSYIMSYISRKVETTGSAQYGRSSFDIADGYRCEQQRLPGRNGIAEVLMAEFSKQVMASDEPIIICREMNKWFGDFHVLRNLTLEVMPQEVLVIIGPSGSGKSTFIRCINRLEEHQDGTIIVDGIELSHDVQNIAEIRRETGMVFQQFNLFPHLTVMDNISLAPMKVRHWARDKAEQRAMELLERVGIPEQAYKYPGSVIRRATAAGSYRARAGNGAEDHALR